MQAPAAENLREDIAGCRDALTGGASDANGKGLLHSNLLPGIRSRNVAFQLLNGLCLTGDNPFHQVADGDNSNYSVVLYHGQMSKTLLGHNCHTVVHGV